MRNVLWLAAFLALPTPSAFARDSLWLLCTGTGTETIESDYTSHVASGQIRLAHSS